MRIEVGGGWLQGVWGGEVGRGRDAAKQSGKKEVRSVCPGENAGGAGEEA